MIAARIMQFDRMRITVKATPKGGAEADVARQWQSKYFDPEYGLSEEARVEAATLVAKKVCLLSLYLLASFPLSVLGLALCAAVSVECAAHCAPRGLPALLHDAAQGQDGLPRLQPHLGSTSHLSSPLILTSHLFRPTSHLSPLTSHLSPLTSHLSPLTSHL